MNSYERLKKSRKAQVTVFIIIGIIILFSVAIFYYMKNAGLEGPKFFQPKTPPVDAFIQQCLENTAREALVSIGAQGGYLVLPTMIGANPTRYVSLVPGVGGPYIPKVPYWYYEGQTEIPSLEYIEYEIQTYVRQNLDSCIQDFSGLRDEFQIDVYGDYEVNVILGDWDTQVKLDWLIDVTPKGTDETTRKEEFLVKMNVPLGRIWNLAKEILEAENQKGFFETMTIDLMASHPPEDIPFTGLQLHCGQLTWHTSTIKEKLNRALVPAITGIRFRNTNHIPWEDKSEKKYKEIAEVLEEYKSRRTLDMSRDASGKITHVVPPKLPDDIPSDSYDYFQYNFNFTEEDYKAFKVMSTYKDDWGMKLVGTPNQYGVLKSGIQDLKSQIMSYLCLNTYHFVYDVVYPVMITIQYPDAFYGEGYTFRYAFPVQIYHNKPDRSLDPARLIEPAEFDLNYCDFYGDEQHEIIARDAVTYAELPRVNLTYNCLRESCNLGYTRTNNRHFIWEGNFPSGCYGPVIIANKSGYLRTEKQYDYETPFYIDMMPTQTLEFEVKRVPENSPDSTFMLEPNMHAIINIEHTDPEISIFQVFDREGHFTQPQNLVMDISADDPEYTLPNTIELLRDDATYHLNIMLLERNGDEDIMIGGWVGNWTVKEWEIKEAQKVVFEVMQKYPKPVNLEDIETMIGVYELMNNHSLHPNVEPKLIRYDDPVDNTAAE